MKPSGRRGHLASLVFVLTTGLAAGCADEGIHPTPEAPVEPDANVEPEPEPDAGPDAEPDAEPEPEPEPDAGPDAEPEPDGQCFWNCSDYAECVNGVVTVYPFAEIPCDSWNGTCPVSAQYTCDAGCAFEPTYIPGGHFANNPQALCSEAVPASEGQQCTWDEDCQPTFATVESDGTVTQTYLACGGFACEDTGPPEFPFGPEWLVDECPWYASYQGSGYRGALDVDNGGYPPCLVVDDPTTGCFETRQTLHCAGDWQCPAGATCEAFVDAPGVLESGGVCRPGARGTPITIEGC
jgi:hypothetical protein